MATLAGVVSSSLTLPPSCLFKNSGARCTKACCRCDVFCPKNTAFIKQMLQAGVALRVSFVLTSLLIAWAFKGGSRK